jgi:hypothetical protein
VTVTITLVAPTGIDPVTFRFSVRYGPERPWPPRRPGRAQSVLVERVPIAAMLPGVGDGAVPAGLLGVAVQPVSEIRGSCDNPMDRARSNRVR